MADRNRQRLRPRPVEGLRVYYEWHYGTPDGGGILTCAAGEGDRAAAEGARLPMVLLHGGALTIETAFPRTELRGTSDVKTVIRSNRDPRRSEVLFIRSALLDHLCPPSTDGRHRAAHIRRSSSRG